MKRQGFWHKAWYRVRQFLAAVQARVRPAEQMLVQQILTPGEQCLFAGMPRYDQRHCLDVYYTLCSAGYHDPLLLRAALIHDCGKVDDNGRGIPLFWYALITLLKKYTPALYTVLAINGHGVLRPVQIYADHAWRGARMAAAAGSPPEIVHTLRHYHDSMPVDRAALLQWADEQH